VYVAGDGGGKLLSAPVIRITGAVCGNKRWGERKNKCAIKDADIHSGLRSGAEFL